jgi:hypothetical protein
MTVMLLFCVFWITGHGDDGVRKGDSKSWNDAVTFRMPSDPATKDRLSRAANWLKIHLVRVSLPDQSRTISVIAWKDPTLEPSNPKLLAGYLITDGLWSAKALKVFDPVAASEIEDGIEGLGYYGNGLHDVLFHRIETIKHRPADDDRVHGFSLGRFPIPGDRIVDLRVFRQRWDANFTVGHPALFAEHAVYQALYDFWQGRKEQAARRVLEVVQDDRARSPNDRIFWDDGRRILVDYVTHEEWLAYRNGEKPVCRNFNFKLGVLLYAIRLLGLEAQIGSRLNAIKQRLWDAQIESGGVAHFVDVGRDGTITKRSEPTGEASAIAILSQTVVTAMPATDQSTRRQSVR